MCNLMLSMCTASKCHALVYLFPDQHAPCSFSLVHPIECQFRAVKCDALCNVPTADTSSNSNALYILNISYTASWRIKIVELTTWSASQRAMKLWLCDYVSAREWWYSMWRLLTIECECTSNEITTSPSCRTTDIIVATIDEWLPNNTITDSI